MFIKSDIEKIFSNAETSEDEFLKQEIIISTLGELLLKDKADVVIMLQKRQINVRVNDSDMAIVNHIIEQIKRSDEYANQLAKFILQKDGKGNVYLNSDSGSKLTKQVKLALKDIVKRSNAAKHIIEAKYQHNFYNSEGVTVKSYPLINVALVLAIGYLGYEIIKLFQKDNKVVLQSGGAVEEQPPVNQNTETENGTGNEQSE